MSTSTRVLLALCLVAFSAACAPKVEEVVVFEYHNQYRFLKFSIDPSRIVFFDSEEWNRCPNKKDLDIEKIALQYNSSFADVKIKIF